MIRRRCRSAYAALTFVCAVALLGAGAPLARAGGGAPGDGASGDSLPSWSVSVIDADQSFRGLDALDARTAWVSGSSASGGQGRVYRTVDAGRSWQDVSPPGTSGLQLRDVEALGRDEAVVLAIGEGSASRVFRTGDGGRTWAETFRNTEPRAFFNCLDFYADGRRGLAVSDPVDGRFRVISTADAGRSWQVVPDAGMPDSTGEANFAASGDCLVVSGSRAFFGTGGARSRVFESRDFGRTWVAGPSGIPAGEAAGVFGLAFATPFDGVAVGGDFAAPADGVDAVSLSVGRRSLSWSGAAAGDLTHLGEDAAFVRERRGVLIVTGEYGGDAGAGGSSVSRDGGASWVRFSDTGFHALDCTRDGACWAAGRAGQVAQLAR